MRPLVIAHRGASGELPENTLPAFERAIEEAADMIETDLHLSRDGVVMIHHDAELERLGVHGEIRDHLAAELAELDAAPRTAATERMPTLDEILDLFAERIPFNLELKVGVGDVPYAGLEDLAVTAVEKRGLLPRMLYSSFYDPVLARLRKRSPEARIALLVSPRAPVAIFERAERIRAEAIHPEVGLVTPELVEEAHAAGLKVYPYTANAREEMVRLLDCGVDGLITNHPSRLHAVLREREKA
ncbi:MAG TPA: glycerophosphodiester phosphodiesterase [Deltaproteobacteria bacterium]|nr:glycerophosphodiester phosphodiesterase [Deltaproteobacteria bacterium]